MLGATWYIAYSSTSRYIVYENLRKLARAAMEAGTVREQQLKRVKLVVNKKPDYSRVKKLKGFVSLL